jgi:hypothetical protein
MAWCRAALALDTKLKSLLRCGGLEAAESAFPVQVAVGEGTYGPVFYDAQNPTNWVPACALKYELVLPEGMAALHARSRPQYREALSR